MNKSPLPNPWKTQSKQSVYNNPWIHVTDEQALGPGNKLFQYGKVHFKNLAVGILPVDEDGNTWLVGQWRYPLNTYSWEIPEGGCLIGKEDPLQAAKRELKEETGIVAQHYQELLTMHLSNSVTDECAVVYLAKQLTFEESEPDPSEQITVKKIPLMQAFEMVMTNQISDAITVAAILKWKALF